MERSNCRFLKGNSERTNNPNWKQPGGFTSLVAADALLEQVVGVALLNSAGQIGDVENATTVSEESVLQKFIVKPVKEIFQRVVLGFLFWQAKQPARVESVLKSVYKNTSNVDDYHVKSITRPADDPNAGEVNYRLMTRFMLNQRKYTFDSVLSTLLPIVVNLGRLRPLGGPRKGCPHQRILSKHVRCKPTGRALPS